MDRLARTIAWILPRLLVKWCFVRVVAEATTGLYSDKIVPEVTALECLKAWADKQRI